jgi:hypothetical protein
VSLSQRIIDFVADHPGATAAQIAEGIDDILDSDQPAKMLYGLAKRGALVRDLVPGGPYRYRVRPASTPSAAQAQAQPAVAENTGSEARRVALHDTPAGASHPKPKPVPKRAAPQHLLITLSNDRTLTLQRGDVRLVIEEEEAVELATWLDNINEVW